ncbi:MAG: DUF3108 domain-containing protein [Bacteroidota bacterium]|nr:DUF3108 domain-containing protein [Bacteroidota bacterium]MDX5447201.1 DUF3108 domain-containing protein [Bacteroidota bacterium]MDX5505884.1 DUF3108 domain-containing protein [Bacteroidota bacterium]
MKRFLLLTTMLGTLSLAGHSLGEGSARVRTKKADQRPFTVGEQLKYEVHYGFINVGEAELMVDKITQVHNRPTYHTIGKGTSNGFWDMMFKVRDHYESYIDTATFEPHRFIRNVQEGDYRIVRDITFDHKENIAIDHKKDPSIQYSLPDNCQDLLSSFYYARSFDATGIEKGDVIEITMFLDHELFPFKLKFQGRETLKVKGKRIRCLKFQPVVQSGRVFKDEETMTIWVSDDANKIPVRLKTDLMIGSIKMDLTEYRNLAYPLGHH